MDLDLFLHVALFAAIGLWFGWFIRNQYRIFLALGAFAALLEIIQWRLGHYPHVEWADILSNEAGLFLALAVLWWPRNAVQGSE